MPHIPYTSKWAGRCPPPKKPLFRQFLGKNRDEKGEEVRKEEGKGKEELEKMEAKT